VQSAKIRRSESHVTGSRGHTPFLRSWLPERVERVLLVVHGFGEHSGRYEGLASWLAARGCAVHAYDHPGHGRSSGQRGYVRRFSDLLDDLESRCAAVRQQHPDLPLFLLGQSMGGLIVSSLAVERQPQVSGIVTTGAALAVSSDFSPAKRVAARVLRYLAPRLPLNSGLNPNGLCRDPAVVQAYIEDPLIFSTMTPALGAGMLSALQRTAAAGSRVTVPMLMMHGEDDPICPAVGTRDFYQSLQVPGSRLHLYPGQLHEVLHEPERETAFAHVFEWLREREGTEEDMARLAPPPAVAP
jgi:alpha-beta hydrolase superfamily lysophospholipase